MHPLYPVAAVRALEAAAGATLPAGELMARAGAAACARVLDLIPPERRSAARVLVLAGPGNNGGDGFVCARELRAAGVRCAVRFLGSVEALPADAARAHAAALAAGVPFDGVLDAGCTLVVDALFGIGLSRPLAGEARALVEALDGCSVPVVALDVPSGLDADTGRVLGGAAGVAVRATHTVSFLGDKPGLHTGAGRDHAGAVSVAMLGLAAPATDLWLNGPEWFAAGLPPRRHDSHKGSYGDCAVLGGADGMAGAVLLAGRAALLGGAGRVLLGFVGAPVALDPLYPELMCRAAQDLPLARGAAVAGPGMSTQPAARATLVRALESDLPLVLDADALNLMAAEPALRAIHAGPLLMTPHPLEAARLLESSVEAVQADRIASARRLAAQWRAVVVLKGSGSVIAAPDGRTCVNPTGNPALATAGSGDVLAGLCGALLAQGCPAWEAALAAVWVHGAAADRLVAEGVGPIGLNAGALPAAIRAELNALAARGR